MEHQHQSKNETQTGGGHSPYQAALKPKKEAIHENFRVYGGITPSNISPLCKQHPCKQNDVMIVDFASRRVYEPYTDPSHPI